MNTVNQFIRKIWNLKRNFAYKNILYEIEPGGSCHTVNTIIHNEYICFQGDMQNWSGLMSRYRVRKTQVSDAGTYYEYLEGTASGCFILIKFLPCYTFE